MCKVCSSRASIFGRTAVLASHILDLGMGDVRRGHLESSDVSGGGNIVMYICQGSSTVFHHAIVPV